jgi:hypothetical protein
LFIAGWSGGLVLFIKLKIKKWFYAGWSGGLASITRYKYKDDFAARWSGGLLSFTLDKNGTSCLLLGGLVVLSPSFDSK